MSIKPVDYQVMIPRTSEVSKMQGDEHNRNQAAGQQQASTVRHEAENHIRQVHSQDKANEAGIREEQEKNSRNPKQGRKNSEESREQDEEKDKKKPLLVPGIKKSTIDIRL